MFLDPGYEYATTAKQNTGSEMNIFSKECGGTADYNNLD